MYYTDRDVISDKFGVQVIYKDERYFLRYDAGELVDDMKIVEVSKNDAVRSQLTSDDAYQVLLTYQQRQP